MVMDLRATVLHRHHRWVLRLRRHGLLPNDASVGFTVNVRAGIDHMVTTDVRFMEAGRRAVQARWDRRRLQRETRTQATPHDAQRRRM